MDITAALTNVSTAISLAKAVKDASTALDEAETKYKIAELISALSDVKSDLAQLKLETAGKDIKIKELEEALKTKESLTYDGSKYIKENYDHPFCPKCYDSEDTLIHLKFIKASPGTSGHISFPAAPAYYWCPVCTYKANNTDMPLSK